MHAHRGLSLGIVLTAVVAAACNASGAATTAPATGAPATGAPAVTAAPATIPPLPSIDANAAYAIFEPKAGATPAVQGGAALLGVNGQTQVVIGLTSGATETMAASIQAGTCDSLTPEAAYRLTDVVAGASTTTVAVDLATLLATPYAINISVAGSETESSITCGEIQAGVAP